MQVINHLPSFAADMEYQFVSRQSSLARHGLCGEYQFCDDIVMIRFQVRDGLNMYFRNHEQMHRRFGLNVLEHFYRRIFVRRR